jgi:2-amino-4-hydroxy-6-hydroxymethyldihydropteridine diphosphokinase
MVRAFIGLGANLGQPMGTLQAAIQALQYLSETRLVAQAPFYETAPIGLMENDTAPIFINTTVELETGLSAQTLLRELLALETRFGRERPLGGGMASRTLDLDLLFYGTGILNEPALQVPHPRLHERGFVLVPLCEIAPNFIHPHLLQTMQTLKMTLPEEALSGIRLLGLPALAL